jgi:peptidoglycan hydrolase-like protein with peptidoglycan-binding domain
MDGLAYLHLAETWETAAGQSRSTNSKMHLNLASTPLLFFTIALTILNLVTPALAIKKGDSGPEVAQLQKTLQAAGYFDGKATGFYGSVTRAAVKKFQADNNLKVDGIVGPQTLSALKGKQEEVSIEAAGKISPNVDRPSPSSSATENTNELEDTTKTQPQEPLFQEPSLPPFKTESPEDKKSETPPQRVVNSPDNTQGKMTLKKIIYGNISPKSIVYSGSGLFFAQNMMYRHTITVYDRNFKLVKTIPDTVNLSKFGFSTFKGNYQGSPVEAAFSTDGKYAYVSNYQMYGSGFRNPGERQVFSSRKTRPKFPIPHQYPNFENRKGNSCRCSSEIQCCFA